MFIKRSTREAEVKVLNPSKKTTKKASAPAKKAKTGSKTGSKKASPKKVTRITADSAAIENADAVKTRPGARMPRVANQVHSINNNGTDTQSGAAIKTAHAAPERTIGNYRFEIGTKFMTDCDTASPTIFTVKNAYADSNTEFRKVWSLENGLEVIELSSLLKDKFDPGFRLVD